VISVGLADDQALVRDGFRLILEVEPDIEVVGEAADGAAAVDMVAAHRPDVVLMDIRMPVLDGIAATKRIVGSRSGTRVLILTTFVHDQYLYDANRAGASGFLLTDARRDQLVGAIKTVAAGEALLAPSLVRRLLESFGSGPPPIGDTTPPRLSSLTDRELDVLRLVAGGLTNAEIAERLFLSQTTVKTHVSHLMQKLGLRDRVEAVVLGYESGLVRAGQS
jgi:DNA-binding NarL/FixJ family response regulator